MIIDHYKTKQSVSKTEHTLQHSNSDEEKKNFFLEETRHPDTLEALKKQLHSFEEVEKHMPLRSQFFKCSLNFITYSLRFIRASRANDNY